MFEGNAPKGFGNNASTQNVQEVKPRIAQKPRHHFDRDVVRPETYVDSIHSRFDSPGRRKTMEERIKALGLTDNDIRRLRSHHKVEAFICLGSDSPLRLIDLLCLNEPELRSLYLEATEARKFQAGQHDRYQELLTQAKTSIEKDNLIKSINTVQTVLGLYCAFENTARDVLKCPKTARQTLLSELRAENEADPSIYQQHKEMREKLAEVKSEKAELKKQIEALKVELEAANAQINEIDPDEYTELLKLKKTIHELTKPAPSLELAFSELDLLLQEIRLADTEGTDIEYGVEVHNAKACQSLVINFVKANQGKYPNFVGAINGRFTHRDVMRYISLLADSGAWKYAPNDLDLVPSGTKTYIADRVSHALCKLERDGILKRRSKGSHVLWAMELLK